VVLEADYLFLSYYIVHRITKRGQAKARDFSHLNPLRILAYMDLI